jgi:hypothetical protein
MAPKANIPPAVKERIAREYHAREDKEEFAAELGLTVKQIYGAAYRLSNEANEGLDRYQRERARLERSSSSAFRGEFHPLIVSDPDTIEWTDEIDATLIRLFGTKTIEWLAAALGISETAALYRARHLPPPPQRPLRKLTKHWDARKVAAWFAMTVDELKDLRSEGIDIVASHFKRGPVAHDLVSTTSLGRWLSVVGNRERLIERGADGFFILEIEETMAALLSKENEFELCDHLSHSHVCSNPYAENSHGLFCSNNGRYEAGNDPRCSVRTLKIHDLRPAREI